jgi:glycosyltransferase involved in cell wall biosynthesis
MESQFPSVSIVMPIRNESESISRSLDAALNQDYPSERIEILIADGMSSDGTREIIERYRSEHKNISLFDNPGQIVSTGLNTLIPESNGDIIARVDGHCRIGHDYIRNCVRHLMTADIDGVGGSIETIGETFTARVIAQAMSSPFGVGDSAFRTSKNFTGVVDTVPFPAYKREIVQTAGLYDEELVRDQDDEFNYRLRGLGAKIMLASDIRSEYFSRSSLGSLWKQYFQYGFWKVRVLQKHPRQMKRRQFVPGLFVAVLLFTGLLACYSEPGRWFFLLVAGPYITMNLAVSIRIASRTNWKYLLLLPVVFSILHLSYGTGFLAGLVRFINRWGDKEGRVPEWEDEVSRME